jgi:hypothetical protein
VSDIHVNKDGQQIGPFSADEINWKLEAGEIAPADEAWIDGMSDWKPLADEIFAAVGVELPFEEEELTDEVAMEPPTEESAEPPGEESVEPPVEQGVDPTGGGEGYIETGGDLPPESPPPPPPSPPPPPESQIVDKIKSGGQGILESATDFVSKIKEAEDETVFLPYLKLIDSGLRWTKERFSLKLMEKMAVASRKTGLLASTAGALLMLTFGVTLSINQGADETILHHALALVAVVIAQFIAIKFLSSGSALIEKSPDQISSKAFLECFALLLALAAFGILSWGSYASIQTGEFLPAVTSLGIALVLFHGVGISLHHESVNMQLQEETTIGEEAIGLLAFFVKFHMRLVPFAFGVIATVIFIEMSYLLIKLMGADWLREALFYSVQFTDLFVYMLGALLLPLTAYLTFLGCYLVIDLVRAILSLPHSKEQ